MPNSTKLRKPTKPHPDYPLTPRPDGRWCKRIKGKLHYFAGNANEALEEWLRVKDDLIAGRTPRSSGEGLTIRDLCNRFLVAKAMQRDAGELSQLTWADYKRTTDRLVGTLGLTRLVDDLRSEDFEALRAKISETRGTVALGNEIQRVRVVFKYAFDAGMIAAPMRYGPLFRRPNKKVQRIQKAKREAEHGKKLFETEQIRRLLDNATPQLKAMILLAVNCGYGNNDCARLHLRALDLAAGWIDFSRPKTGIDRRCPLWPETVAALKNVLSNRRVPKDAAHADLVFITAARGSFAKETTDSPIAKEFAKLVTGQKLQQRGRGFYSLRHTFRTVARHAKDLEATRAIMGHESGHVEEGYEHEPVEDSRLQAVVDHVRNWLFAKPVKRTKAPTAAKKKAVKKKQQETMQLRVVG